MTSAARSTPHATTTSAPYAGVIGDIGGTHHRFAAVTERGELEHLTTGHNTQYDSFESALRAFLSYRKLSEVPRTAFAIAGPVLGDSARLTNCDWTLSRAQLRDVTGASQAWLENDLQAVARALPLLPDDASVPLGPSPAAQAPQDGNLAVIGLGTGLGVAALVGDGDGGRIALASEAGHMDMAARSRREHEVLERARRGRCGVTGEQVLAGPGFATLYACVAELHGVDASATSCRVIDAFTATEDPVAAEAKVLYTALLGSFASSIAQVFNTTGGIYFAGSIANEILPHMDTAALRARFDARPGHESSGHWLNDVPLRVISHQYPALLGLAALVRGG